MRKLTILECTLRDGSYPIEYQFTAEDTAVIVAGLEDAGFRMIEIGHGLGLNASNAGEGVAAATDEEYLSAAASTLKKAKFGMFFIPGIGREEDLKLAAKYGMDFVRIGTNAPEVEKAEKYIKIAKKLDMIVSSNLMKSYALTPKELAEQAKLVGTWGADIVYVVDSAGGMLQRDVKEYVESIRNKSNITIGFHGHNNFSLAIANTLAAIDAGATMVDSSLQGIGRSAGNAQTEILMLVLDKMGYETGIDSFKAMDLADTFIKPLMRKGGISSIDVTEGYALFHSKFLKNIYEAAERYGLDPRDLIIKASEKSVLYVPKELAMTIAKELAEEKRRYKIEKPKIPRKIPIRIDLDAEVLPVASTAKKIARELSSLSKKMGKTSVFTIAVSPRVHVSKVFPFIRESSFYVVGNSEASDEIQATKIAKSVDGVVDVILVDAEKKSTTIENLPKTVRKVVRKSKVHDYKDEDVWIRISGIILSQLKEDLVGKKITIFGCGSLGSKLALNLAERGASVVLYDENIHRLRTVVNGLNQIRTGYTPDILIASNRVAASEGSDILIGATPWQPAITQKMIKHMSRDGFVFDAGVGTIFPDAIDYALKTKIKIYRIDVKAGLSGEIVSILETDDMVNSVLGRTNLRGVSVVAGGVIGRKGEIVVDSVSNPTKVLGVANGRGGFLKDASDYLKHIEKVKLEIIRRKISHGKK